MMWSHSREGKIGQGGADAVRRKKHGVAALYTPLFSISTPPGVRATDTVDKDVGHHAELERTKWSSRRSSTKLIRWLRLYQITRFRI